MIMPTASNKPADSDNINIERITATSGSRYPNTATDCDFKCGNAMKYRKHPNAVFIRPSTIIGNTSSDIISNGTEFPNRDPMKTVMNATVN